MIDRDFLEKEYQNKSLTQISKEQNIPEPTLRDYLKRYGIRKNKISDILTKDVFEKEYITNCLSLHDIAEKYNFDYIAIKNLRKRYGIKKDTKDIHKATESGMLKKYGEKVPLNVSSIREKYANTNLQKFGTTNPLSAESVKEKIKQTNIERYGVESPLQCKEINNKRELTLLEKYGSRNIFECSEVQEKSKATLRSKYNCEFSSQIGKDCEYLKILNSTSETLRTFINTNFDDNPTIYDLCNKTGYTYSSILYKINSFGLRNNILFFAKHSKIETDVYNFLKECGVKNIQLNTREVLNNNLELDIYLPDYKIGIEVNGAYWHCDKFKTSTYHQNKSLLGESAGIFIYHIFEHEWKHNSDIIKSQLCNLLKINKSKIYARQCVIKQISIAQKKKFLEANHLQGNDKCSHKYGLFYKNDLVAVMTFCKARFSNKYTYELSRFCTKLNLSVVGGFSKLFKYFTKNILESGQTIITYSDFSKGMGNTYKNNGFTFDHLSAPNYIWINFSSNDLKTRYQTQIKNENTTMHEQKYYKIYNSGNKVWIYQKSDK